MIIITHKTATASIEKVRICVCAFSGSIKRFGVVPGSEEVVVVDKCVVVSEEKH